MFHDSISIYHIQVLWIQGPCLMVRLGWRVSVPSPNVSGSVRKTPLGTKLLVYENTQNVLRGLYVHICVYTHTCIIYVYMHMYVQRHPEFLRAAVLFHSSDALEQFLRLSLVQLPARHQRFGVGQPMVEEDGVCPSNTLRSTRKQCQHWSNCSCFRYKN